MSSPPYSGSAATRRGRRASHGAVSIHFPIRTVEDWARCQFTAHYQYTGHAVKPRGRGAVFTRFGFTTTYFFGDFGSL